MNYLPNEINRLIFSFLFQCKNKRLVKWDVERNNFNCIVNKETNDIFNNITRLCKIRRYFTCKYQNVCINCDKWVIDLFPWKPWNKNEIELLKCGLFLQHPLSRNSQWDPCWRKLSLKLATELCSLRSEDECYKTYMELKLWEKSEKKIKNVLL